MIIRLHQNLINKIAAGEVVERPASVLKELMENAVDAKATRIDIRIKNFGSTLIEVSDNGSGMSKEDAVIAYEPHTTSKISTLEDLNHIGTLGFRGEALASIASVSTLALTTKTNDDTVGLKIVIEGGVEKSKEEISAVKGTTISVEHLFHNTPARKKFLKSSATEYKHVLTTFTYYALAFPYIHFTFSHNNKSVYNLPAITRDNFNDELRGRLSDIFGTSVCSNLVPVLYASPTIQINGFLGHPRSARKERGYQFIFLNKRPISDKLISKAVLDTYHTLIQRGEYPIYFLFLTVSPALVDVNVHPRKTEVRFQNSSEIYKAILQAGKHALLKCIEEDSKKALETYPNLKKFAEGKKAFGHQSSSFHYTPKYPFKKQVIQESLSFSQELLSKEREVNPVQYQTSRAFQIFNNYIIFEKENSLIILDQHAAAERVTFEKLQEQIQHKHIETQRLLLPETIELTKVEFLVITKERRMLERLGIKLVMFGKSAYKIEEIPALIAQTDIHTLMKDILAELVSLDRIEESDVESFKRIEEKVIATMACHSSIRAGMKLKEVEIQDLVHKLLRCKIPYSCPHGRPIIWEMKREELERKFKRH